MPLVHLHAGDLAIVLRCAASVADAGDDMVLGIEAGALRDGAPWWRSRLARSRPTIRTSAKGSRGRRAKIKIDNVNRELVPKIGARPPMVRWC